MWVPGGLGREDREGVAASLGSAQKCSGPGWEFVLELSGSSSFLSLNHQWNSFIFSSLHMWKINPWANATLVV